MYRVMKKLRVEQSYLDGLPVAFCVSDVRDLRTQPIIFISAGFTSLTGYTFRDCLGRNCRFLQGPASDPRARHYLRRSLEKGERCHVAILNYRRDGTKFWNHLTMEPLRDVHGALRYYVGIQVDITDYVHATPAQLSGATAVLPPQLPQFVDMANNPGDPRFLVPSHKAAFALSAPPMLRGPKGGRLPVFLGPPLFVDGLAGLPRGFVITDARAADQPVIYASDGFLLMTGYSMSEVLGQNCRFLQGRDTNAYTISEIRNAIKETRPITRIVLNYRKDGTPFYNMLAVSPVYGQDIIKRIDDICLRQAHGEERARKRSRKASSRRHAEEEEDAPKAEPSPSSLRAKERALMERRPELFRDPEELRLPDALLRLHVASDDEMEDLDDDVRVMTGPKPRHRPLYFVALQVDVSDYPDLEQEALACARTIVEGPPDAAVAAAEAAAQMAATGGGQLAPPVPGLIPAGASPGVPASGSGAGRAGMDVETAEGRGPRAAAAKAEAARRVEEDEEARTARERIADEAVDAEDREAVLGEEQEDREGDDFGAMDEELEADVRAVEAAGRAEERRLQRSQEQLLEAAKRAARWLVDNGFGHVLEHPATAAELERVHGRGYRLPQPFEVVDGLVAYGPELPFKHGGGESMWHAAREAAAVSGLQGAVALTGLPTVAAQGGGDAADRASYPMGAGSGLAHASGGGGGEAVPVASGKRGCAVM